MPLLKLLQRCFTSQENTRGTVVPSAQAVLECVAALEDRLSPEIKDLLKGFAWRDRAHKVELENGRLLVHFFSDGLDLRGKTVVERFITSAIKGVYPEVENLLVYFERKDALPLDSAAPKTQAPPPRAQQPGHGLPTPQHIPGVKNIIAVGSGKGGVGKSTMSVNLAVALAQLGYKVGLLDGDVYGPNIPMMMGVQGATIHIEKDKVIPPENYGVKVMSIGFFASDDMAVIWRGPMISRAMKQFFDDVHWGELDFLLIDLPPGTGDTQLTMVQNLIVTGAIIVTTPQNVATQDASKGLTMFRKTEVPILGIVENMSGFQCPHCGQESAIFGNEGGQKIAERYDVPLLGKVPLLGRIREGGDAGRPQASDSASPVQPRFLEIARALAARAQEVGKRS